MMTKLSTRSLRKIGAIFSLCALSFTFCTTAVLAEMSLMENLNWVMPICQDPAQSGNRSCEECVRAKCDSIYTSGSDLNNQCKTKGQARCAMAAEEQTPA